MQRYIPEVYMNQMHLVNDSLEDDQFNLFSVSTENKLIFLELLEILFGPTRTFDIWVEEINLYLVSALFFISNMSFSIILSM